MEKPAHATRLHDFFLAMARRTFGELGVGDEAVVTYVATVLTDFAHADRLYPLRNERGQPIDSVVRMQHADPALIGTRELHKYVGDYTLFMSGVFRAHIEQTGVLGYYLESGSRSYWQVSALDLTRLSTNFLFFQQLAKNFEYYSGALDYMRKAHFAPQPGQDPFADFKQRVQGWISSGLSDN